MTLQQGMHYNQIHCDRLFQSTLPNYTSIVTSAMSKIVDTNVLRLLALNPRIELIQFDSIVMYHGKPDPFVDGKYDPGEVHIKLPRSTVSQGHSRNDFNASFQGYRFLSQLAQTHEEAVGRTLMHEIAHHIQRRFYDNANQPLRADWEEMWNRACKNQTFVSPYSSELISDYWAELVVAYTMEPRVHNMDVDGIAFVKKALTLIK